jgi:hypothetical protein
LIGDYLTSLRAVHQHATAPIMATPSVLLLESLVDLLLDCFCVLLEPLENTKCVTISTIPDFVAAFASEDECYASSDQHQQTTGSSMGTLVVDERSCSDESMALRGNNG